MTDEYNLEKELKITKEDRKFAKKVEHIIKMLLYGIVTGTILYVLYGFILLMMS